MMEARFARTFRWLALALLGIPALGQAQFSYLTNKSAITITGLVGGGNVVIPDTINGLPVTRIGEGAFQDNTNLSIVYIPNSVTNLGPYAFSGCVGLIGVVLPAYLPNLGDNTFYNCFQLTDLTIPDGVANIGSYAFFQCSSLENVTIPGTVIAIQEHAFENDWRLGQATLSKLARLGDSAFAGCSALTNLLLGSNLQDIGAGAFSSCSNLASLVLPKSVASVGAQAFAFCTGLQTVYFTGNAPLDSGDAFLGDSITFVDYLPQTKGWGTTFGGAPAVLWNPQASPPRVAPAVGPNALSFMIAGDESLNVIVEASTNLVNPVWVAVGTNALAGGPSAFNDTAWTNVSSRFYRLSPASPAPFFCVLTNGGVMITRYRGSSGAVTIPDTINGLPVTAIGSYIFEYGPVYGVTSVVLGSNVTTIAPYAFADANGLSNVVLDVALKSIGSNAFSGAFGVTNVFIPKGVTNVDPGAFRDCYNLAAIDVDPANSTFSTVGGVLFNKSQTALVAFPGGLRGSYAIPNGVTNIVAHAFEDCTAVTFLNFPNTLRTIGDYAFADCASLNELLLPSSLASLGNAAFQSCHLLGSAVIDGGTVGNDAFANCDALGNLTLGANVTSIGSNAFTGCALTSVFMPRAVTNIGAMPFADASLNTIAIDSLNPVYGTVDGVLFDKAQTRLIQYPSGRVGNYSIPETVTQIGDGAFWSCTGLTNVTIPNAAHYLGSQAFNYCINLASVALPNSITNIPYAAFEDCQSLTNLILGTNIIDIGFNAFAGCGNLEAITLPTSVVQIEPGAFGDCRALRGITLGNQVVNLGYDAFFNCFSLSKVIIQSGDLNIGDYAFGACPALGAIYFTSNAPVVGVDPFYLDSATIYYLFGTTGWGPTLGGLPTVVWNPGISASHYSR
jgi:hypothetical protein